MVKEISTDFCLATDKKVSRSGMTIYRIAGGKIVEWWNKSDLLAMMQQLGAVPVPGQPKQQTP